MSTTTFLQGLAEMTAAAGIGVWDPDGTYTDDQIGITIVAVPQSPSQLIVLTAYTFQDDPQDPETIIAVQFRTRGDQDPRTVQDRDDAIFSLFQGMRGVTVGGHAVVLMWRQSAAQFPQDTNLRWERTSNYYAQVTWATANRTDWNPPVSGPAS